jgi:catechol 2,3-dioxygenase-like lactoylglutathione lyase family enzyme
MTLLWAPFEVADLAVSERFYRSLGLSVVDSFDGGLVFGVGPSGRIEIAQTATRGDLPPTAIELPDRASVDRLGPGRVFPRGHYGFVTADPDGNRLLIWSEREASA